MTQARDLADGKFDTDTLVVDAAGNRVGIGTTSPNGNGALTVNAATDNSPQIVFTENDTAKWLLGHRHDGDHFRFYDLANSAERVRIQSGGGISFNGDTAAANALDDYEVGTWTAVLGAATTDPTATVGNSTGHYVKVGDIVHFTWYSGGISFSSIGVGNGHISGLPYTAANGTEEYWVFRYEHGTAIRNTTGGYIVKNADRMFFTQDDTTAGNTWYSSGGYIMVSGSYRAA